MEMILRMQKIPVTRDGKKGSEIIIIDSEEVLKIERGKDRQYLIHTNTEKYYLDLSFESIEEWLFEDGFRLLDSTNIVNIHHIEEYDDLTGKLYLGDPKNKKTITASAARIHKQHVDNILTILQLAKNEHTEGEVDELLSVNILKTIEQEADDRFLRSYATIRAVTERKKAEDKIIHMAYHDALTNLPNRLLFNSRLNQLLVKSLEEGKMAAVFYLDIDRFKLINDTLGHQIGDELLKQLGSKLKSFIYQEDTIARFSGDEYILLHSNMNHIDEITDFAKQILKLVSEPFVFEHQDLFVTASIGISLYPLDGMDADTLIKNADTAMYRAKDKGGNSYQLYHSDMSNRSMERLTLEIDLRRALDKNEIRVYYQPLLDLDTGFVYGMESLVRWDHPRLGIISPGQFIPLAEETGLIVPIGNWVLEQACMQNKTWLDMGLGRLSVSVNISASQFHQPNFVGSVEKILKKTGLPPELLCLEVTENVAMKNISHIENTMAKLFSLGIQISIDDFGTGYSSLSYLKRFQVQTLKIDQSFIKDINQNNNNAAIVTALIAMSHQLNIIALAEGVETQEQLEFLRRSGCDRIQGYVFSRPVPSDQFETLIRERKSLYGA
jgi:diguanylate cyclase (GGDEF)-like protein